MMKPLAACWPPRVGDRLRLAAPPGERGDLLHVVAVFEHADEYRITTALWWPGKQRWHYETYGRTAAMVGLILPDA